MIHPPPPSQRSFSTPQDEELARWVSGMVSHRFARRLALIAMKHGVNMETELCRECYKLWPCPTFELATLEDTDAGS